MSGRPDRTRTRRRRFLICVALAIALGGGVGAALAATSHPTTIVLKNAEQSSAGPVSFGGYLTSPKENCLPDRKVKLIVHFPSGNRVLDTDRSSAKGAWHVGGNVHNTDSDTATVKVTRKTFGPVHHLHVCRADSALEALHP
jgi:hypothetical protein